MGMGEILVIVLSSSVIAGIIANLFGLIQNRKKNSLEYITEERKKWRNSIKEISEAIQQMQYESNECSTLLVKLQLNINAYGRYNKYNYKQDSHIWQTIDRLKSAKNKKEFEKNKELLLFYISLMLKSDWERSKKEVKGISGGTSVTILYVIFIVLCFYNYFIYWKLSDEFVLLFFVGICFLFFKIIPEAMYNNGLMLTMKNNKIKYSYLIRFMVQFLIYSLCVLVVASFVTILYFINIKSEVSTNVSCYYEDNRLYINCDKLNTNLVKKLQKQNNDIIIVYESNINSEQLPENIQNSLNEIIEDEFPIQMIIFIFMLLAMFILATMRYWDDYNEKFSYDENIYLAFKEKENWEKIIDDLVEENLEILNKENIEKHDIILIKTKFYKINKELEIQKKICNRKNRNDDYAEYIICKMEEVNRYIQDIENILKEYKYGIINKIPKKISGVKSIVIRIRDVIKNSLVFIGRLFWKKQGSEREIRCKVEMLKNSMKNDDA